MPFPRPVVYSGGPTVALATGGVLSGVYTRAPGASASNRMPDWISS